jgi:hypothetical protein
MFAFATPSRQAAPRSHHEVGVTLRPLRVPKLDTDYFNDEST